MKQLNSRSWWLLAPLMVMLALSCRSGKKLYAKGQYDKSITAFIRKLKRKPTDATSLKLLPKAYDSANAQHVANIREFMKEKKTFKWEKILDEYYAITTLGDKIKDSKPASSVVQLIDYTDSIVVAKEKAANVRYKVGVKRLNAGGKDNAKMAYTHFRRALELVPGYKDAEAKMNEAFEIAVINISVKTVKASSDCSQSMANQIANSAIAAVNKSAYNTLVRLVDANADYRIDRELVFDISLSTFGPEETKKEELFSDKVKTGTEKDTSGKETDIYESVSGTRTTITQNIGVDITTFFSITGNGSVTPLTGSAPSRAAWTNTYIFYKGDERALPTNSTISSGSAMTYPEFDTLFPQAQDDAINKLANALHGVFPML